MLKVSFYKCLDAANRKAIRSVIAVQRVQPSAVEIQSSTLQITNAITGGRPIVPLNTYASESTNLTVTTTRGGEVIHRGDKKQSFINIQ